MTQHIDTAGEQKTYVVQIKERWDYEVEAYSEAEAKQQATELREMGLNFFGATHAKAVYDLGTTVMEMK